METATVKPTRSILADLGTSSTKGVVGGQFTWKGSGILRTTEYAFSLRNKLREDVTDVHCYVIFYDTHGTPIDTGIVYYAGIIPAGLAKRVTGEVDSSVRELMGESFSAKPRAKVEFRIFDFRLAR